MSNGHRPDCDGCQPCDESGCPEVAYCVNEVPTGNLCSHHAQAVCAEHWPGTCPDCRLEAEREMYRSGDYDPRADPFFDHTAPKPVDHIAENGGYWWDGSFVPVERKTS